MLRHIVMIQWSESATPARVERIRTELAALHCPGRVSFTMGPDLGLRPGNMDAALVADFDATESYLAYDADAEHGRIRRDLIAPIAARIERCQFAI